MNHEEVDQWVLDKRAHGLKIGFTCGAFDILHAGHVNYLNQARAACDCLLVAVNSDESIKRYKDPLRPLNPQNFRMEVLAGLRAVDAVTSLDETRPANLIQRWKPDLYIKGGDYTKEQLRSTDNVESYGGRILVIPIENQVSTTKLVERAAHLANYAANNKTDSTRSKLILLDRDGTLIENIPHLKEPSRVRLLPGVGEGLRELQGLGFKLIVVTNQQGIGIGYFDYDDFVKVNQALFRALGPYNVKISKIYYCPHSAADDCGCRKPGAELILRAMRDFNADPEDTFFIGDTETDMQAARAAGVHAIYVPEGQREFSTAIEEIQAVKSPRPS